MFSCVTIAGLAWLAFGGYTNYGEDVWGRRLNYYLIPIMVSELRPILILLFVIKMLQVFCCSCRPL